MVQIVDRRKNGRGKSTENRQKFLERVKDAIKDQLPDIISQRKIKDMDSGGADIVVKKNLREPSFRHGRGGDGDYVVPGNRKHVPGDKIPKPPEGGSGRGGSEEGQWEDEFIVNLSRAEFLHYFFEGLELPELTKKSLLSKEYEIQRHHAGYVIQGSPHNLNILRSFKQALARKIPAYGIISTRIKELEEEIGELHQQYLGLTDPRHRDQVLEILCQIEDLQQQVERLRAKRGAVPMFDPLDLRYRQTVIEKLPTTHATMIMIMDNSGSMEEREKTIARKFFYILYKFLKLFYKDVDMRFVSHTTQAEEMEEDEFFTTQESGGTIVSTGLNLASKIIAELGDTTNIYVCQVSDGENWSSDNGICKVLLDQKILPYIQYYAYIQVEGEADFGDLIPDAEEEGDLWLMYARVAAENTKFQMQKVYSEKDIFPVFRKLFEKAE